MALAGRDACTRNNVGPARTRGRVPESTPATTLPLRRASRRQWQHRWRRGRQRGRNDKHDDNDHDNEWNDADGNHDDGHYETDDGDTDGEDDGGTNNGKATAVTAGDGDDFGDNADSSGDIGQKASTTATTMAAAAQRATTATAFVDKHERPPGPNACEPSNKGFTASASFSEQTWGGAERARGTPAVGGEPRPLATRTEALGLLGSAQTSWPGTGRRAASASHRKRPVRRDNLRAPPECAPPVPRNSCALACGAGARRGVWAARCGPCGRHAPPTERCGLCAARGSPYLASARRLCAMRPPARASWAPHFL